ncbi:MAG: inositol monophosphatase [Pseudomonadota bacterium]
MSAAQVDPLAVDTVIREVAEEHVLPLFRNLGREDVSTKSGPTDLVTVADVAAEQALIPRLTALLPGSRVLGEEGAAKDPKLLGVLDGDEPVWVVDPIDGTRNFVNGSKEFATMVALVERGETLAGWIYPPVDGDCAIVERGSGARWKGEAMRAGSGRPMGELKGTYHRTYFPKAWRERVEPNLAALGKPMRSLCSAYVYLRLATGENDYGLHGKLMPWDHAAGTLMLREAGGRAGFIDAEEHYAPQIYDDRPLLTCSPAERFDEMRGTLVAG